MANVVTFQPGGYRFIEHAFQYSGGVAAEPGFAIERVRLVRMLPLAEGFDAVEAHLQRHGRPPSALCACELRSPAQFTDAGFVAFNRLYVQRLESWEIFHDEVNPVARSNVCPEIGPPETPSLYAFCYTVPAGTVYARTDFVAAGSGEADGASGPYAERIVRYGDTSADGLREKARFVLGAMERRMAALGRSWADVTATQLYTVFDIYPAFANEFVRRGATAPGLTWHYARPPVLGLDVEVDVRGVSRETVLW
jgi:hypothetical protein